MQDIESCEFLAGVHWNGREAAVALQGDLDYTIAGELCCRLSEVARVAHPRRLVIDLAAVPFVDCAAARAIAGIRAELGCGSVLVLRSLGPLPQRLFALTGLGDGCVLEQPSRLRSLATPAIGIGR